MRSISAAGMPVPVSITSMATLLLAVEAAANGNGAGGWRVLTGVGEQPDQHLAQQGRVALGGEVGLDIGADLDPDRRLPTASTASRIAAGTSTTSVSPAPSDSTRARVSSARVSRFIRSASSARRSRKWSWASGSSLAPPWRTSIAPEIPASGLRSSWAALETKSASANSRRISSVRSRTTARTARSSGSERACIA